MNNTTKKPISRRTKRKDQQTLNNVSLAASNELLAQHNGTLAENKKLLSEVKEHGIKPHDILAMIANGVPIYYNELQNDNTIIRKVFNPSPKMMLEAAKLSANYFAPKLQALAVAHKTEDNIVEQCKDISVILQAVEEQE